MLWYNISMKQSFQHIIGLVRSACETYNLIENGDKIAVGLSGGKDSLMLLTTLVRLKKFYPKQFEIIAISIDIFDGKTNYEKLKDYCKKLDVNLYVINSRINDVVFNVKKENNPCSLCAKLRRGILNSS